MTAFSECVAHIVVLYEALEAERDRLTSENERLSQELQGRLQQQTVNACFENLQPAPTLQPPGMHCEKDPGSENHGTPPRDNASVASAESAESAEQVVPPSVSFADNIVVEESCLSRDLQNFRRPNLHLHSNSTMTLGSQGSQSLAELKSADLKQMFRHICTHLDLDTYIHNSKLKSFVSPSALAELCVKHDNFERSFNDDPMAIERNVADTAGKFAEALKKLQQSLNLSNSSATAGGLNFGTYKALVTLQEQELSEYVDKSDIETLRSIRNCLIKESVSGVISEATRVDHHDLLHFLIESDAKWLVVLETVISVVILANAIIMGVNCDIRPNWIGWTYIEFGFTFIFCLELAVKLLLSKRHHHDTCRAGLRAHFWGKDSWMNCFDAVVVIFSILDCITTALVGASGLGNISIARLTRLARLARLGKVLRFRIFKNLLLLLNGAVWGMRILFWSLILLIFVVYFFGLLLRQTIGVSFDENGCSHAGDCKSRSENILDTDAEYLFGSVPRAMWTVFRCITGDCATSGGQPIAAHLANTHGVFFVITYVLCIVFVTFGLFNLIMAIFVENTLEYAKYDDTRRRELKHSEHVRTAQMLERLMMKFVQEVDDEAGTDVGRTTSAFFSKRSAAEAQAQKMQVKISLQTFERVLLEKEVQRMLDDLDIPLNSRRKLFDTLDADGNGTLSIRELATGIVKLRGPADKTDIISVLLITQRMQEIVHNIELEVHWLRDSFRNTWGLTRSSTSLSRGTASLSMGKAAAASGSFPGCGPLPEVAAAPSADGERALFIL